MAPAPQEKTFSTYNEAQGKHYAQIRPDYHPTVYEFITSHHKATGGQFDTVVDVGCGPGNVARYLAPQFVHAYGIDPAPGMIGTARELGGASSSGEPIQYVQGSAEEFGKVKEGGTVVLPDGSVDLVTSGNAAHWFDMQRFWQRAAEVLRPGGSVALWTTGDLRIHPKSPAAEKLQEATDLYRSRDLEPYFNEGNRVARNKYRDLILPWTAPDPVTAFDEAEFLRREWTIDEQFVTTGVTEVNMDMLEKVISTSSPYTRWCEAHPDDVHSERDIIRILRRTVEKILQEAGVEKGKETVKGVVLGAVLIVKKKSV